MECFQLAWLFNDTQMEKVELSSGKLNIYIYTKYNGLLLFRCWYPRCRCLLVLITVTDVAMQESLNAISSNTLHLLQLFINSWFVRQTTDDEFLDCFRSPSKRTADTLRYYKDKWIATFHSMAVECRFFGCAPGPGISLLSVIITLPFCQMKTAPFSQWWACIKSFLLSANLMGRRCVWNADRERENMVLACDGHIIFCVWNCFANDELSPSFWNN